jgi:hypothetical protein
MNLQQKKELEGRMEEILKEKKGIEEREMKSQKEKDDSRSYGTEDINHYPTVIQTSTQVPLVIEATMEEQLLNIGEVMKRFREKIKDLQL